LSYTRTPIRARALPQRPKMVNQIGEADMRG